ncbi:RagB/SusD family nutrient uptake outer membrane protein [Paraflavisolibacter sp. H34]|uniref:RagB/SusD family nutrient uptake outer membrane protein n=1 Tax=Huijunlia imazamoxiresistens TaxID=3127457 RepID=UPI003018F2F1
MKSIYKHISAGLVLATLLSTSCQKLDEYNPATISVDQAYKEKTGLEGAINGCYTDLYFLHGKIDFIGPTELGTDSWINVGSAESGFSIYDNTLNTTTGTLTVMWNAFYSIINYCNTAINYAKDVKGYNSQQEVNAKVAEAYFIRAYANFNLVEQFGGVVLLSKSAAEGGIESAPKRSTEKEFYDAIIADLKFACDNLPYEQALRGRVTKKAAYGLLSKVYLQRTRLGEKEQYAQLALAAAEELINNPVKYKCALYASDAAKSGFTKLWEGANNKNNSEFLFIQAIDATAGLNPEGYNRGRTRQYYLPDLGGRGAEWGARETSILYGRSNTRRFRPTKYLLTTVFEPSETTADTRFKETFTYKFYANADKKITDAMATAYNKDASVVGKTILGTTAQYAGPNYFLGAGAQLEEEKNMTNDAGLAVFTPNWTIDPAVKRKMPMLVADPSDLFSTATGDYKSGTEIPTGAPNLTNVFPAMRKFSSKMWVYTNQYWMGDMPIIRLGDIYLVAAEAALLAGNDQQKAAGYINVIRKRAALKDRENEQVIAPAQATVDFLVQERARELSGEQWRWYDLKRTGKLTKSYLQATNNAASVNFDEGKHKVRPIPQSTLDAITNAQEFGTNGY